MFAIGPTDLLGLLGMLYDVVLYDVFAIGATVRFEFADMLYCDVFATES